MGETTDKIKKYRRLFPQLLLLCITSLTLVMGIVIVCNSTLGWFAQNRNVHGTGATVRAQGSEMPLIRAWRFDMATEDGESFDKTGTWVEGLDLSTADVRDIKPVETMDASASSSEQYSFISLHLGTVDNLLDLSDDNCFYIRVDITPLILNDMGTALRASYSVEDLVFYSNVGNDETSTLETSYAETFAELLGLVDFDCAVSATAYDMTNSAADATAVESLFGSKKESGTLVLDDTEQEYIQLDRAGGTVQLYTAASNDTGYYLYIRMRPDLETCFDATHDISMFMPCQLVFDISIELEFVRED